MSYQEKYLKYKSKYLKLKEQYGGTKPIDVIMKELDKTEISHCSKTGFINHAGECWSDATIITMLFADNIKEHSQPKLFNKTIDIDDLVELALTKSKIMIPLVFRAHNKITEEADFKRFIKTHLENLRAKFLNLYKKDIEPRDVSLISSMMSWFSQPTTPNDETFEMIEKTPSDEFEMVEDGNGEQIGPVGRALSTELGIRCAADIIYNSRYGLEKGLLKSDVRKITAHGGVLYDILFNIQLLAYIFINNNRRLTFNIYNTPSYTSNTSNAYLIMTSNHIVAVFECNGKQVFYDDNKGIFETKWRDIFKKLNYSNQLVVNYSPFGSSYEKLSIHPSDYIPTGQYKKVIRIISINIIDKPNDIYIDNSSIIFQNISIFNALSEIMFHYHPEITTLDMLPPSYINLIKVLLNDLNELDTLAENKTFFMGHIENELALEWCKKNKLWV
jgi:hypothetical protein